MCDDDPPAYVTRAECIRIHGEIKSALVVINRTLVGEDMRGGLVKDVQEIKSATSAIKTVVVPIVISVLSALTTYGLLTLWGKL
jgi:hypothetical protein